MNGRAYDYNLGRFLSVDPFIQSPGNSQSMNPYSYIMNNPLAGTDPSGYKWETVWDRETGTLEELEQVLTKLGFEVSNGYVNLNHPKAIKGEEAEKLMSKLEDDGYIKKRRGGRSKQTSGGTNYDGNATRNGEYKFYELSDSEREAIIGDTEEALDMVNTTIEGMDSGDEYTAWLFEQWTGVSMSSEDPESKETVALWRSKLGLVKFRLEEVLSSPEEHIKIYAGDNARAFVKGDSFPIYVNKDVYFKGNGSNRALVLIHETGHIEGMGHKHRGYAQASIIAYNANISPTASDLSRAKNNLYGLQFFAGGIKPDDPSYKYFGEGLND